MIRDKITARVAHGATESVAGPRFEWIGNCKPFDSSARLSEGKHMVASAATYLFRRLMLRIGVCLDVKNTESCCTAVFRFDNQQDLACTQSRLMYKHKHQTLPVLSFPFHIRSHQPKTHKREGKRPTPQRAQPTPGPDHTRPSPHPGHRETTQPAPGPARTRPSPHPGQPAHSLQATPSLVCNPTRGHHAHPAPLSQASRLHLL